MTVASSQSDRYDTGSFGIWSLADRTLAEEVQAAFLIFPHHLHQYFSRNLEVPGKRFKRKPSSRGDLDVRLAIRAVTREPDNGVLKVPKARMAPVDGRTRKARPSALQRTVEVGDEVELPLRRDQLLDPVVGCQPLIHTGKAPRKAVVDATVHSVERVADRSVQAHSLKDLGSNPPGGRGRDAVLGEPVK